MKLALLHAKMITVVLLRHPGFALPTIHYMSTGAITGADAYFAKGQNVVFVVVGDPTQTLVTDAGLNGYALHVLAFPTNPAVVPYP